MNEVPVPARDSVRQGILLTLCLHVVAVLIAMLDALLMSGDARNGLPPFLGIGLLQVLYVLPALVLLRVRGRGRTLKGLLIGAGITALVNVACAGIVIASIR